MSDAEAVDESGFVRDAEFTEGAADADSGPQGALLTLKQIADELGVGYARLRGFADAPGVKDAVGAVNVPGVKGDRYPQAALVAFEGLIEAQDAGEVNPKTAAAWLKRRAEAGKPVVLIEEGAGPFALARQADVEGAGALTTRLLAVMQDLADATRGAAAPETLYTLSGAAATTGLSQKAIRAGVPYVLDGGRRKYAASDLKAFLSAMPRHGPSARTKSARALPAPDSETTNETP